jgi:DNA-binding GntR family transcriptional regulator
MKRANHLIRDRICEKIRKDINEGRLFPGEKILQAKLAKDFDCSHAPIREALRQLESEGLLFFERNKGCSLRKLSIEEIDQIYAILGLLEGLAGRLSSKNATRKDIALLKNIYKKLERSTKARDLAKWITLNTEFHKHFLDRSNSEVLSQVASNLKSRIYAYRRLTMGIPRHFERHQIYHKKITEEYDVGNSQRVEKYMRLHLDEGRKEIIKFLKQNIQFI